MMKRLISKILFTMLLCMFGAKAYAYDIEVASADGVTIYYNYIKDGTELEVTYQDNYNSYSGSVVIPEEVTYMSKTLKVTSIGNSAFFYCSALNSVTIPNSMTSIGNGAFYDCNLLEVISMIKNPFDIDGETFENNTFNNAILYVPAGTIDKYKATEGWKNFMHFVEGSPSGIKDPEKERANELRRYSIDGRVIPNSHKGINIIQMEDGTTKKVIVK